MSDRPTPHQSDVLPVDQAVGGDADSPGIAQPVTQDEIDDILNDQTMPIEERQMRLEDIRNRLGVRESADRGSDMSALEYQIDEALSLLADGGHVYGTLEGAGIDPSERADTRSPDDDESLGAPDAIGGRDSDYHARVNAAFLGFSDAEPHRFAVVDGGGEPR